MSETTDATIKGVIFAAGGLLCRQSGQDLEIMVVRRKRYEGEDLTLPKGKVGPNETFVTAAVREVREETGCVARVEEYLGAFGYLAKGVPKTVLFWRMSLLEQGAIEDQKEVAEALWMPVALAAERLKYPEEKAFVLGACKQPQHAYVTPAALEIPAPLGHRRWFWPQKSDHDRLLRETASFRIELALVKAQSQRSDLSWAQAASDDLVRVEEYLKKRKDVEGGWVCFHSARRHALWGLGAADLARQASMLRAEATKFQSWRSDEMKKLLSVEDKELTAGRIIDAMALRDEYSSNQYHKIWLMANQLAILLGLCALGIPLLAPLVVFFSHHPDGTIASHLDATIGVWGYQMVTAVLFFGLLGAAFSTALSLINATGQARIPERVGNGFVTIARAIFGAGTGLAGYAFYESNILNIRVGSENGPAAAFAVAFLFGFAGEFLIARVLQSLGANKS